MSKQPTKIERLGTRAEQMVWKGKAENKGYRRIAEDVNSVYEDEEVSHMAVKNYINNRFDQRMAEMGMDNLQEVRKQEVKEVLDVAEQLEELNNKLQDAIENLNEKDRTDMGMLLNIAKEVRQQLKFHKEYVEEMTTPDTQINNVEINKTEIAMKVVNQIKELEDDGVIEVKDREKLMQEV